MAKSSIFIVLASAICFFSFFASSHGQDDRNHFVVHGTVYCDTCNVQFVTKLSAPMAGAKVKLQCVDFANEKNVTLSKEATTDEKGSYSIEVEGDHAEEDCEVTLISSSRSDCAKLDSDKHLNQAAKVSITNDNGLIHSPDRIANALGFMKDQPLAECAQVLKELSLNPDGTEIEDNS
ncbi:pollen-specific protein-like At4g18596 [Neltuma alba]|uniref:pollen-specific protein-like At4g18596 n=1 Tax=Neltuma alba TaxID=207710 RepID=UPI0010A56841|nr:pollen-specific protein-like At4g18596 [Prosopis alba]XP_028803870.1 pollen-specific protein-like At4g18596 [Prosopis alba]